MFEFKGNISIPKLIGPQNYVQESIERLGLINHDVIDQINERTKRDDEIKEASLAALQQIVQNTSSLTEIMFLIKEGNIARDEIYNLIAELLRISLASDKAEAESIFWNVLGKANELKAGVELVTFLTTQGAAMISHFT